jgi:hypothetical protein
MRDCCNRIRGRQACLSVVMPDLPPVCLTAGVDSAERPRSGGRNRLGDRSISTSPAIGSHESTSDHNRTLRKIVDTIACEPQSLSFGHTAHMIELRRAADASELLSLSLGRRHWRSRWNYELGPRILACMRANLRSLLFYENATVHLGALSGFGIADVVDN